MQKRSWSPATGGRRGLRGARGSQPAGEPRAPPFVLTGQAAVLVSRVVSSVDPRPPGLRCGEEAQLDPGAALAPEGTHASQSRKGLSPLS